MKSISINLTLGVMYCVMLKTLKQVKDNALRLVYSSQVIYCMKYEDYC